MTGKPFKAPSFIRRFDSPSDLTRHEPPKKKRRVLQEDSIDLAPQSLPAPRPTNPTASESSQSPIVGGFEGYYNVLWRKITAKKHKTWDGDGILVVCGGFARLQDISGKELGKTSCTKPLLLGSTLSVGGKDVEIDSIITKADFLAGRPFLQSSAKSVPTAATKPYMPPEKKLSVKSQTRQEKIEAKQVDNVNSAAPTSKATRTQFKNPLLDKTSMPQLSSISVPVPRHDPKQPGALVMKRPSIIPKGKQIVDVVVDPLLCRNLRDHQRQGVSFLYECVMGMRSHGGEGAVLADEMGLGKTLQTIALLWTLLKQNPVYDDQPVIRKALIVCPVTLITNWRKEFRKWLGLERIGVFVAEGKFRVTDFTKSRAYQVMVIGYEKLRSVIDELKKGSIDIVIADEGHRLKTAKNKSAEAIKMLNTERRVILSGTPVQNDLTEFFVMVDLVNPGLLGKYSTFKKEFENPIVKSRQPEATDKDLEKGEGRSKELMDLTGQFILRRTADILSKYLPPKTEYVLFCRPTAAQAAVYRSIVSSPVFGAALGSNELALQLINILKKVCNSPSLLQSKNDDDTKPSEMIASLLTTIPSQNLGPSVSAKIRVLDSFLHRLRTTTNEKVILVSNYTSTLDILGRLLTSNEYPFTRLDGSTPTGKRQGIVDQFNNSPANVCFAFLLSAKSGGAGLNLIGASRLVLYDVDWNPATDLQAMARIHRDGQKRPCRIYRLLVKGALDEKIYQRQLMKQGLADAIVDNKSSMATFSKEELRKLFTLDEREECQTHTLLNCECGGRGNLDALTSDDDSLSSILEEDGVDNKLVINDGDADDNQSDSSLPDVPALLMKASQVNIEEQERRIKEEACARMAKREKPGTNVRALMKYLHIEVKHLLKTLEDEDNPEKTDCEEEAEVKEELINDKVLMDMLKEPDSRVDFLFAKTSG
ncbi:hypothetical protein EJ05DRAFT_532263 [Pseudovirgaria hyperparasitica]|uniref:DNA repair and recombination protein RAD26 n=1 Tax=Pseudovirgaria hyperparasitica TaxID=470096 RepID=A0A6A6W4Y7_9PEZI|nr:uncharacterized protein EJ05DRAFT_532263 [Pseudovirgaria hyperparasitica]KAF2756990.1 hypothetical protein EJ05DRAFT_532263 [Pseudovirgaria hyperparasitica]